jgi:hypothetical protein
MIIIAYFKTQYSLEILRKTIKSSVRKTNFWQMPESGTSIGANCLASAIVKCPVDILLFEFEIMSMKYPCIMISEHYQNLYKCHIMLILQNTIVILGR